MAGQFTFSEVVAGAVETALELVGLWLLWRLALSPAARAKGWPERLADWPVGWLGFSVLVGGAVFAGAAATIAVLVLSHPSTEAGQFLEAEIASELAAIAWCLGVRKLTVVGKSFAPTIRAKAALAGGAATFLIMFATGHAVENVWRIVLESAGAQPEGQDMTLFYAANKSPSELVLYGLLVVVGAPVLEELVFRGGLYAFARARLPQWEALLVPACLFAVAHGNVLAYLPLVVHGVILSLAYKRTGNLAVPMVAHGLNNLHFLVAVWFLG
jgi:hypothetical protein